MPQLSDDDFFSNEEINIDREDNDSDNDSLETDSSEARFYMIQGQLLLSMSCERPLQLLRKLTLRHVLNYAVYKRSSITSESLSIDASISKEVKSSLHKHMETYKQFGSIFMSALSQEWSNILRAIKDCAGIVSSPYGLDPTCLSGHPLGRKEDPKFQVLLKKDGVGKYMCLAPILFKKHDNMVASKFLARFLVSPDLELSSISGETCIPYNSDYDLYVEKLSKKSNWALHVFDHVNHEVFGKDSQSKNVSLVPPVPPTAQPHTWEDEMLSKIENPTPHITAPASPTVNTFVNPAFLNSPSALLQGFDMATHSSSSTSSCHGNMLSVSTVSQLQLEVESSHAAEDKTIVDLPEPLKHTMHNTTHAGKVLKTKK
ncbi:hypothetical protein F5J12DRAFT_785721 [Pisolithus orientalis]|uniref:uncharacterized protein n=1 Tax=Pisolithus orientalis TaxID=936130 RepID=UPI002224A643|nr:uncharacterized protein F5J12DRAFT_785721 [Pisolithus orientalis]KAI5994924.1 hypothetical protein F5J12DRAFT_785721 [Pisolithus orientalis]